jgi:hypothetical protein
MQAYTKRAHGKYAHTHVGGRGTIQAFNRIDGPASLSSNKHLTHVAAQAPVLAMNRFPYYFHHQPKHPSILSCP